jgi:protein-S-isoprenylcysteine O-methyltransferase Ste14
MWLIFRVMQKNSFASPIVEAQKERGHKVIDTGPYAYVRHPMYS